MLPLTSPARRRPRATATSALSVPPTVSIIIPAYNEQATIERCLLAAVDQTVAAHEIIVVDNNSTDATTALARRVQREHPDAPITVLEQSDRQGIIPTRNRGFAAATGTILGRIDSDTVIAPDWVERVIEALDRPEIAAVSGPTGYYDLPFRPAPHISDDVARRLLFRIGARQPFLIGCNMAMRAAAWHAIESAACHDHDDLFHEDIDLAIHLSRTSRQIAYDPAVRADISARRLATSPKEFRFYTARFDRTYASHGISNRWDLRAPEVLLRAVHWWTRALRVVAPASGTTTV